jgi:hypothetical protein
VFGFANRLVVFLVHGPMHASKLHLYNVTMTGSVRGIARRAEIPRILTAVSVKVDFIATQPHWQSGFYINYRLSAVRRRLAEAGLGLNISVGSRNVAIKQ